VHLHRNPDPNPDPNCSSGAPVQGLGLVCPTFTLGSHSLHLIEISIIKNQDDNCHYQDNCCRMKLRLFKFSLGFKGNRTKEVDPIVGVSVSLPRWTFQFLPALCIKGTSAN
jgi:hypothetical protein